MIANETKYTMTFAAEDHDNIGKYAARNVVPVAHKHSKQLNLGESSVCHFRNKYLDEVAKHAKARDLTEVSTLKVVKHG